MVPSPKHVAPIIVFDEFELDDVPMTVTYSSDHDWEKHNTFDIENLFDTNSENVDVNIVVPLVLSMFLPMMMCLQNTLWRIALLLLMIIARMSMIFSVHPLLRRKQGMITICLLFLMMMVMRIIILLNLLLL
jgi:hypothetical protein